MKPALILLNKSAGMTSFDCIRRLKKILNTKDLGHGGTLDKFATGVLPVFTGEGLKLARFCLESYPTLATYWKTYRGTIELGTSTTTADPEGEILKKENPPKLSQEQIQNAMNSFCNREYLQVPPVYSAKKIDGKRASDRVREGEEIILKPNSVFIRNFKCLHFDGISKIDFNVNCSKGTYVRSLAVDLAEQLQTFGFVSKLERTAVGDYKIENAFDIDTIEKLGVEKTSLTLSQAAAFIPEIKISDDECRRIYLGQLDALIARIAELRLNEGVYCAKVETQTPIALFEISKDHSARFVRAFLQN